MENYDITKDPTALWIKIDGELLEVSRTWGEQGDGITINADGSEFVLFTDSESAGEAAADRWRDMAKNDPKEFACIIGETRLTQWALGQHDSFGINSLENFLEVIATVPEEEFAGYDHTEREINAISPALEEELGFTPTVAYRCN